MTPEQDAEIQALAKQHGVTVQQVKSKKQGDAHVGWAFMAPGSNTHTLSRSFDELKQRLNALGGGLSPEVQAQQQRARDAAMASPFATRVQNIVDGWRGLGDDKAADSMLLAMGRDALQGRLNEESVAFRENNLRQQQAKALMGKGPRPQVQPRKVTVQTLQGDRGAVDALPQAIQDKAIEKAQELADKMAALGLHPDEITGGVTGEAAELKRQWSVLQSVLHGLAGRRYEQATGKVPKDEKKAARKAQRATQFEDEVSQLLGIDTRQHAGVKAGRKIDAYGDYKEPAPVAAPAPATTQRVVKGTGAERRVYSGSTYRIEQMSNGKWLLTADGTALGAPYDTREAAVTALDAVAPRAVQNAPSEAQAPAPAPAAREVREAVAAPAEPRASTQGEEEGRAPGVDEEDAGERRLTEAFFEEGELDEDTDEEADAEVADEELDALESKIGPGPTGPEFMSQAFTERPSIHLDAWHELGINPGEANNLPVDVRFRKLVKLYQDKFNLKVVEKRGAITQESVDNLLDGYRNITAMMAGLGLPQNAVGLNGTLTLRLEKFTNEYLGAYQPATATIYMPGRSNSFGHEWMHALDHFLTNVALKHDKDLFSFIARKDGVKVDDRLQGTFADLLNLLFKDQSQLAWEVLRLQMVAAEKDAKGNATNKALKAENQLKEIYSGKAGAPKGIQPSEYAKTSTQYDPPNAKKYWVNPAEMLARAFESYLSSQRSFLPVNEFVTKPAAAYLSDADDRFRLTFPKDAERQQINFAFDQFFDALRVSNELGTGPAVGMPAGDSIMAPERWSIYPRNQTQWQHAVEREKEAYEKARGDWGMGGRWSWNGSKVQTKDAYTTAKDSVTALVGSMRGRVNIINKRNKSPSLRRLRDMLFVDRGEGRAVGRTYHEAVSLRSRNRINDVQRVLVKHDLTTLKKPERELLRLIMISGETMLGNKDVAAKIDMKNLDVANDRIDRIARAANDLRYIMNSEFYYNRRHGISLGYTKNGYLPRIMDFEAVMDDLDGFEAAADKTYGAMFDRNVGQDDPLNVEEFDAAAKQLVRAAKPKNRISRHQPSMSQDTRDGLAAIADVKIQIRSLKGKITKGQGDPKAHAKKIEELEKELDKLRLEVLPHLRTDWAALMAHAWRTRLNTTELADYDTIGPAMKYTKNRALPPEADVLMEDYYIHDPLDAIAEYLDRSTRRVEYAKRFGKSSEKLEDMLNEMRDDGVPKADRDELQAIVNNLTGRENQRTVPSQFIHATNTVQGVMTIYMLGRSAFASMHETVNAAWRTGNWLNLVKPFGLMMQDLAGTKSALDRRSLANLLGLVTVPYADALMANRMTGDSYRRSQSLWMSKFFERILLGPMTRAQQRATMAVGQVYLESLAKRVGHQPSQAELAEMGISRSDQPEFAAWLKGLKGRMPNQVDLIDPHTGDFTKVGQLYGTAIKRFTDQVIMEPSKMDKPKLATDPVGRFAFGLMSFQYGYWNQVQKPFLRAVVRDFKGVYTGPTAGNMGRTRAESAVGLAGAAMAVGSLYALVLLFSTLRAALVDRERWEEHEKKGDLGAWLLKLAFSRAGFFGPLDPLAQAVQGLRYQRDLTTLMAGAQFGSILHNIQDIGTWLFADNPGTNTNERKAAKAFYNLVIGPVISYAAAVAPGGPITGTGWGVLAAYLGSTDVQGAVATGIGGEKFNAATQKRVKQGDGTTKIVPKRPSEIAETNRRKRENERSKTRAARIQAIREELAEAND